MNRKNYRIGFFLVTLTAISLLTGCVRPNAGVAEFPVRDTLPTNEIIAQIATQPLPTATVFILPTRQPDDPVLTPTPDEPRVLPTLRTETEYYTVQANDSIAAIAALFGVDVKTIQDANALANPNLLFIGQQLVIPPPANLIAGPAEKLIPDSELVYGPATVGFDPAAFIAQSGGYLSHYTEDIGDGTVLSGAQIVTRVAQANSVNPRLLLAIIDYQNGWVTLSNPSWTNTSNPLNCRISGTNSLYNQLSFIADRLDYGYYLWKLNAIATYTLADGRLVRPDATINAGTAAIQYASGLFLESEPWQQAVSSGGIVAKYKSMFGEPFDYTIEPLLPADLSQPAMTLPFAEGETWSFTGGPHGGWGLGSAWAALDFAPPGEAQGCSPSTTWDVAVADGVIARVGDGAVILDLDGDGYEQTGWTVLYMHVATEGRVAEGTVVKAGDPIGHPSCEGGYSQATHLHIARRYNGEWISADGPLPFNMDGWISEGTGVAYDGYLRRNDQSVEAWNAFVPENQITR